MINLLPAAVCDTNTVVSAFILPHSYPARALSLLQRRYRILLSQAIRLEMEDVLSRSKFNRHISLEKRRALFRAFVESCEAEEPQIEIQACRHPKDDKFLSLAVSGNAALILTGDKDLLALHPFRGIPILTPAQHLAL